MCCMLPYIIYGGWLAYVAIRTWRKRKVLMHVEYGVCSVETTGADCGVTWLTEFNTSMHQAVYAEAFGSATCAFGMLGAS